MKIEQLAAQAEQHLREKLIPFWKQLKDEEYGGFYGWMDFDLKLDKKADKGCILNSRILWFFSNAALRLPDPSLLSYADHAYQFFKNYCLDSEYGGVYWAVHYDGSTSEELKHTYNQAFAVYALSSYYAATRHQEALQKAFELIRLIEERCTDELGYLEAFHRDFTPAENEKLSENGVMAEKTMNTLLHVFESYCEAYRVLKKVQITQPGITKENDPAWQKEVIEMQTLLKTRLQFMLDIIEQNIFNPKLGRQEVFFDREYHSLLDLHSYGHDIETAWLLERGLEILEDPSYTERLSKVSRALEAGVYEKAYREHSLLNECECGKNQTSRIWWVQAEAVVGFLNAYRKTKKERYLLAAEDIFEYIMTKLADPREGAEWFWELSEAGIPESRKPIVEPWKCPYHNGRMCMELMEFPQVYSNC